MSDKNLESLSNIPDYGVDELSYAGVDEYVAECEAKADAMSDKEVYEHFMARRKAIGSPIISFEEFMGESK